MGPETEMRRLTTRPAIAPLWRIPHELLMPLMLSFNFPFLAVMFG